MSAYNDLMAFQRETEALAAIAGRLGWDQETMMPSGAAEQRGEEMAAMESVLHARRVSGRLAYFCLLVYSRKSTSCPLRFEASPSGLPALSSIWSFPRLVFQRN